MKIAFTTKGKDWDAEMDPRFGRTEYLFIYDEQSGEETSLDNREVQSEAHGAGPKTAQKLAEAGAQVLITGNGPGGNAASVIQAAGITVYIGASSMSVKEAYQAYTSGKLSKQ
ncbi:MAG TPA: dinitrogenase iron-molybdenum cofactor biosynthesis protein [Sediminispirochaeta sp.]|nr:dinitrogenase iron-molybdenum cofactor biosynthesis protein [Sediminispirochaeta sp.]